MNKKIIIAIILLTSPIWLLLFGVPFFNHIKLQAYARTLFTYPLPPQTKIVSKSAQWIDVTESAGCISDIRLKLSSNLPYEEVRKYYADAPIKLHPLDVYIDNPEHVQISNPTIMVVSNLGDPYCLNF